MDCSKELESFPFKDLSWHLENIENPKETKFIFTLVEMEKLEEVSQHLWSDPKQKEIITQHYDFALKYLKNHGLSIDEIDRHMMLRKIDTKTIPLSNGIPALYVELQT